MVGSLKKRFIDVLTKRKLVTSAQIEQALKQQKEKGGNLGKILLQNKFLSETTFLEVMSQELEIPLINLNLLSITPDVIKKVPKQVAEQYGIMPISIMGKTLTVAMSDPLNVVAMDDLKVMTGLEVKPVLGSEGGIHEAFQRYYERQGSEVISELMEDVEKNKVEFLTDDAPGGESGIDLAKGAEEGVVVRLTNMILLEAIRLRSSDVLIEPFETVLKVRYRVDGILRETQSPPRHLHGPIIGRLKILSHLNIAEHRVPQDGRFKIKAGNRQVDFRISVIPSYFGEKICLRVLDRSAGKLNLADLGFEEGPLAALRRAFVKPHGLILVCGPTGAGKSSTLYSVLREIDTADKNLVTVEDPVEYQLNGVNQVTAREGVGLTFARALRSILRQDPDVIMIGEIRDSETADIAIKSALTGHLVLSTLHTNDATATIIRLANMGVEPFMIASSLIMVMAQRLLRKLCTNCRAVHAPDAAILESMDSGKGLSTGGKKQTFYKAVGCPECARSGYRGRIGLAETLEVTPKIRELIMAGNNEADLRRHARLAGMSTLRENGLKKAARGVTSLEEVMRLTAPEVGLNHNRKGL